METPASPVIAFDFDGVIASYHGFISKEDEQAPNPEVLKTMRALKEKGCRILIHSTRGDAFLKAYCEKNSVPFDYINRRPDVEGDNPGKPIAFVYVDDHALQYRGQDADTLISEIENFKPYWK